VDWAVELLLQPENVARGANPARRQGVLRAAVAEGTRLEIRAVARAQ
jgi:hypothetical protein